MDYNSLKSGLCSDDFGFGIHVKGAPETRIFACYACQLLADLFTDSGGKRRKNAENRTAKCVTPLFSIGKT
jgi:hypothetical protein